jgi:phage-related baseplate assembly protein
MAASWNDLIAIPTRDAILDKFIGLLRLAGFPVASWHSGSFQKHTVETESTLFTDVTSLIQTLAKAGSIRYAAEVGDVWVDLCATDSFSETRKPSVYTQGKWTLYDTGGIGPVTIQPGSFWVGNADGSRRFINIDSAPVTLPLNGSVQLTIQAESPGSQWNVGVGTLTEILTPQPGLEGSNEADPATGTWITQQGADVEANTSLVERCLNKWATLGSGANDGAYAYHATRTDSEITRCRVYSPYGGAVRVVIAGPSGPVSITSLLAAAARVAAMRPLGVPDVLVLNASVRTDPIAGVLSLPANTNPNTALVAAQAAIDSLARATQIGARVSREKVIWALMNTTPDDLELTSPAADFQLGDNEIWVPNYSGLTVA